MKYHNLDIMNNRFSIKFGGESGQGINTLGELLSKAIKNAGYKTFSYREYPSLIRGGVASYQTDFSNKEISSSTRLCNILAVLDEDCLHEYLPSISENGILIYDDKEAIFTEEEDQYIETNNISKIYLDTRQIATQAGGEEIMSNVAMLAFIWRIMGLSPEILEEDVIKFFENKNVDLEKEKAVLNAGYNAPTYRPEFKQEIPSNGIIKEKRMVMSGNAALSLGLISAGVRAYYAYPMTPATSILKYIGNTYKETGILVKQAENEITAAQMVLGSMAMGTRALTATSGGGLDLMLETVSCAGISETPMVLILSQRSGAGTGVPTWTGAGDVYTATKGGHGEFPRCVIAVSDVKDSYTLVQKAFNIAEQYQLPVIVLTEKQISESLFSLNKLPKPEKISRGNMNISDERYELTEDGISPRWLPTKDTKPYVSTSDEHLPDGTSTEKGEDIIDMSDKRQRKLDTLRNSLPEPTYYGDKSADKIFVGWGSVKNTILDVINNTDHKIGYLHYEYISPLKTATLNELIEKGKDLVLIENNQTGEFGKLIREETGYEFKSKLLKYNARPFFIEDILDFLQ
jgi:2-oxoglutarate ferredoxin oxidoreductase subunit alpha